MAPSSGPGGLAWLPIATRLARHAIRHTKQLVSSKLGPGFFQARPELQPILIPLRKGHAAPRGYTQRYGAAFRRFFSSTTGAGIDRTRLVSAVARQTRTARPFASTLRPNLTSGTVQRGMHGGSRFGSGTARNFSSTSAGSANVTSNVAIGMRAFLQADKKGRFAGAEGNGIKRFRVVGPVEKAVEPCALKAFTPRPFRSARIDFRMVPGELGVAYDDLDKLQTLGALQSTRPEDDLIRFALPGVDVDSAEALCHALAIQRGMPREENWSERDISESLDPGSHFDIPKLPGYLASLIPSSAVTEASASLFTPTSSGDSLDDLSPRNELLATSTDSGIDDSEFSHLSGGEQSSPENSLGQFIFPFWHNQSPSPVESAGSDPNSLSSPDRSDGSEISADSLGLSSAFAGSELPSLDASLSPSPPVSELSLESASHSGVSSESYVSLLGDYISQTNSDT